MAQGTFLVIPFHSANVLQLVLQNVWFSPDLQVSRSVKGRRRAPSPSDSPIRSRLGPRSVSETHLNHTSITHGSSYADKHSSSHTDKYTLPNGLWKHANLESNTAHMHGIKSPEEKKVLGESLPNVQLLKSYFEKLGEEESRESGRQNVGGMKKGEEGRGGGRGELRGQREE